MKIELSSYELFMILNGLRAVSYEIEDEAMNEQYENLREKLCKIFNAERVERVQLASHRLIPVDELYCELNQMRWHREEYKAGNR